MRSPSHRGSRLEVGQHLLTATASCCPRRLRATRDEHDGDGDCHTRIPTSPMVSVHVADCVGRRSRTFSRACDRLRQPDVRKPEEAGGSDGPRSGHQAAIVPDPRKTWSFSAFVSSRGDDDLSGRPRASSASWSAHPRPGGLLGSGGVEVRHRSGGDGGALDGEVHLFEVNGGTTSSISPRACSCSR